MRLRWREQADFTFDPEARAVYSLDWTTWKWVRHTQAFQVPASWYEWSDFWEGVLDVLTISKKAGGWTLPPDTVVLWKRGVREGFVSVGVVRVLKAKENVGIKFPTGS